MNWNIFSFLSKNSNGTESSSHKSRIGGKRFKTIEYSSLQEAEQQRRGLSFDHDSERVQLSEDLSSSSSEEDLFLGVEGGSKMTTGAYSMKRDAAQGYQDLIYSKNRVKKLRIILGIVGVLLLAALIAVLVVFVVYADGGTSVSPVGNPVRLDDVLSGKLQAARFNGSWTGGSTIMYKDQEGIYEYDVQSNKRKLVTNAQDERVALAGFYEKSADGKYLLLGRNHLKVFRHSFAAIYDVLNIETGEFEAITINGKQQRLLLAKWAPIGNSLILNFGRNLYYKPSVAEEAIQITSDTHPAVVNGVPDWVYEEEVFSSNTAVWFNPSGSKLSYIRFDDTPATVINLPYYGEPGDLRYQYPLNRPVAYPKAGSSNPLVSLHHVDLKRAAKGEDFKSDIPVPSALNTEDHIITVVEWLDDDLLLSVWMNRIQNRAYLQVSNDLKRYEILKIEPEVGWVDLFSEPFKNKDGSQIALLLSHNEGSAGGFKHLHTLSTKNSNKANIPIALTTGKYVVQSILHWDFDTNVIFYTANTPDKSNALHIYAVRAVGGEKPQCLSCGLETRGIKQSYFSAEFSVGKYVVITSTGPDVPSSRIFQWSYNNGQVSLKEVAEWETNEYLVSTLVGTSLPDSEIHTVKIDGGFTAKVLLQLPPGMDRSGNTKYPMLVDVYGGPDSYSVTDRFSIDWGTYLTTSKSIIYAKIDGRGSGLRGDKLLQAIYLKLGTVEITDQIEVARSLQKKLAFIDSNHTGIWGWSYGGYASAMALVKDQNNVFRCAASIAPVTDWAYYDSIYTERYMGLPSENIKGYADSRLTTLAPKISGKKFLLVHGTLDDNVHYQQSMLLAKNLEHNDILFKQISYPDEDHGLAGVRPHLYHSLDKFFTDCFGLKQSRN